MRCVKCCDYFFADQRIQVTVDSSSDLVLRSILGVYVYL